MKICDRTLKGKVVRFTLKDGSTKCFTVLVADLGGHIGGEAYNGEFIEFKDVHRDDVIKYDLMEDVVKEYIGKSVQTVYGPSDVVDIVDFHDGKQLVRLKEFGIEPYSVDLRAWDALFDWSID